MELLKKDLEQYNTERLSKQEERVLYEKMTCARIALDLLRTARDNQHISDEEYEIGHREWNSRYTKMRDTLFHASVWLALSLARYYSERCSIPLDDLSQEAMISAITGVDKFDPDRGRLSTCVHNWVSGRLRDIQGTQGVISIGRGAFWKADLGRRTEQTRQYSNVARHCITSLSRTLVRGGKTTIGDMLVDRKAKDINERVHTRLRIQEIQKLVARLPEHYRHTALGRCSGKHLEEIARELGITKEAVRQIETRAYDILFRWHLEERNERLAAERLLADGSHFMVGDKRVAYDEERRMKLIAPFLCRLSEEDRWLIQQRYSEKKQKDIGQITGSSVYNISQRERRIMGQLRQWYFERCA